MSYELPRVSKARLPYFGLLAAGASLADGSSLADAVVLAERCMPKVEATSLLGPQKFEAVNNVV